jgi:hypothetical protein
MARKTNVVSDNAGSNGVMVGQAFWVWSEPLESYIWVADELTTPHGGLKRILTRDAEGKAVWSADLDIDTGEVRTHQTKQAPEREKGPPKAVSLAQKRFFQAQLEKLNRGERLDVDMSREDIESLAATPEDGLPARRCRSTGPSRLGNP